MLAFWVCHNTLHKPAGRGGLKATEIYSLPVPEARSLNQGVDRAMLPLNVLGGESFLASSSIPWFVAA